MGRRTLRDWLLRPLMDIPAIERRQACISVLVEDPTRLGDLQDALAGARDAERALSRLSLGTGMPRDLAAIRDTLRLLPRLRSFSFPEPLAGLFAALPNLEPLRVHLDKALEEELPRK